MSSALRSFSCDRSCRLAGCSGTTPAECGEGTPGLCRQRYAAVHRELLPMCRRPWRSSDRVPSALSLRGALRRLDGPPIGGQGKLHRVELDCRFRRLSLQVDNFPPGPCRRVDDWGVFLELRSCPCFSVLSICPRAGSRSCRSCVAPLVFALLSRRGRRGSHGQLDWSGPFTSARVSRRGVLQNFSSGVFPFFLFTSSNRAAGSSLFFQSPSLSGFGSFRVSVVSSYSLWRRSLFRFSF